MTRLELVRCVGKVLKVSEARVPFDSAQGKLVEAESEAEVEHWVSDISATIQAPLGVSNRGHKRSSEMKKKWTILAALLLCFASVWVLRASEPAKRAKIAEGEYLMKFDAEYGAMELREPWSLWRTCEGGFEVRSELHVRIDSQEMVSPATEFVLSLGPELHLLAARMSGVVPGTDREATLNFELNEGEFRWSATRDGAVEEEAKLGLEGPYGLAWPLPWFLGGVVRHAARATDQLTPVTLVLVDDDDPVDLIPLKGEVRYLGEEEVVVAGRRFRAGKFEIQSTIKTLVWVSREGIVLAMQDPKRPEQRMELVRYEKYAEFGPGAQ